MSLAALLAEHATRWRVHGAALAVASPDGVEVVCSGDGITPETRFAIASITKPMVAAVVGELAADGQLGLDDAVATHVPELQDSAWAQAATVRQLLANTSGIPMRAATEWSFPGDDDDVLASFASAVAADPAVTPPGQAWSYTNTGWSVLGRLIEAVTGAVWEDAMCERLFVPLKMADTGFSSRPDGAPEAGQYRLTATGLEKVESWAARAMGPAGGTVRSTVADIAAFMRPHLDEARWSWMREEQALLNFPWFLDAWCLGWARFDWPGGPVWGWDGIGAAHRSVVRFCPRRRLAVVLTADTSSGRGLYRSLFRELLEPFGVSMPVPPVTGHVEDLSRYEGRYAWPDAEVRVTAVDDGLEIFDGSTTSRVTPADDRTFIVDADDPDGPTLGFSSFDADGRPRMLHHLVWGFPRVG